MRRPGSIVTRSFSASTTSHRASGLPPVVATSRPTLQFTNHHDVAAPQVDATAFRQGWRVQTRLDQLLDAGRIDREQWDAARTWRRWVETTTPLRSQAWDVRVDQCRSANDTAMLHRVTATTKLREAAQALGELRIRLLELHVVRDASWREIAARAGVSDKTVKAMVIEALEALADHCAGRVVASPPVLRYRIEPGRQ